MPTLFEKFFQRTPKRPMTITLISAENLPEVRSWGTMKVYAAVSVNGMRLKTTEADTKGKRNPKWANSSFEYQISGAESKSKVVVELWCERTLGDRLVCKAEISMEEVVQKWERSGNGGMVLELHNDQIQEHAGPHGKLNISYSFR